MPVSKDHYYRLASNLPKERIQAATALLQELEAENSESDFKYALQRLISGLASGRDSARIGFSMCLTELISLLSTNEFFNYTAEKFLSDLETNLNKQIKDKQKGKNLRAYLFGKIFGIQSLINSTLIKADDEKLLITIIDALFEVALTKSWIREIAIVTIVKLITKFNLSSDETIVPYILQKFSDSNLILSMDGLLVYLSIPSNARAHMSTLANLKANWKNNDPLSKGNLPLLKDAFLDRMAPTETEEEKKELNSTQKGSWNPQLHYVWAPLLLELCANELNNTSEQPKSKKQKTKKSNKTESEVTPQLTLSNFWPTFDATFFSNSASSERKHTGLQILELCFKLPNFQPSFFSIFFDENLTRCLINHVSKKDRVLHNLAIKVLANATETAKNSKRVELIKALEAKCILFDRVTKTKTIKDIMSAVSSDNIENDVAEWSFIVDWVLNCESELLGRVHKKEIDGAKHDIQTFIFDSLLALVRGNKKLIRETIAGDNEEYTLVVAGSIQSILKFLAKIVYVSSPSSNITDSDIKLAKDRLQSILADVMECTKGKIDWSGILVTFLNECEKNNSLRSSIDSSDELMATKEKAFSIWNKLGVSIKSDDLKDQDLRMSKCLVMLCSTALLELYGGDSESFGVLDDLINIYDDFTNESGDSDNILNTLIDLLLSYLTQKSGLKKRIGTNIWESIVHDVNAPQLERLYDVLMTRENKQGMEELFNQAIDNYEESDEDDEDDEEKHKHEHGHDHDENSSSDDDSDSEDDDSEDESEEDEDSTKAKIEEVEKSTTSALAKALNVNDEVDKQDAESDDDEDKDSDDEHEDDDDDEDDDEEGYESDESMSDEQMMAIDSQLSVIFQQRQNSLHDLRTSSKNGNERKLEAKDARELMSLCKLRILDLLELYVNVHQTNQECASISVVLLDVMNLTIDIKVGEKAHKLIKKICKNTFKLENVDEQLASSLEMIESVLVRASKSKFTAYSQACSQVSLYIVRSLVSSDKEKFEDVIKQVTDLYNQQMVSWAVKSNNKSGSVIFTDLVNWISSKRANDSKTEQTKVEQTKVEQTKVEESK